MPARTEWGCPACGRRIKLQGGKMRRHKGRLGEDRGDGWCPGTGFDPDAPASTQAQHVYPQSSGH